MKKIRTGTLYIIKNKINNKVYIGQTTISIDERWKQHIRKSKNEAIKYKLSNAIRKHGAENFYIEALESSVPMDRIDQKEVEYIEKYDSFKNGYNSTRGADKGIFSSIEEKEIVRRYLNGESSIRLENDIGVSWRTIIRVLEKHNVGRRDGNKIKNDEEFIRDYLNNMPLKKMSDKYKVDIKTIGRKRNRLNLPKRKSG